MLWHVLDDQDAGGVCGEFRQDRGQRFGSPGRGAAGEDVDTACKMEADGMSKLFGSPVNASLLNIFFLTDRNKKDTGVTNENVQSRVIKSVSVIGAGIMGSGIAAANIKRDIPLTLSDANHDVLERGVAEVLKEVSYNKKTKTNDVDRVIQLD